MVTHRMYRQTALVGLVVVPMLFVAACSRGPGSAPTDEELPTLNGSWQRVETATDDDGVMGVRTITLSFTKSRFIWYSRTAWDNGESYSSESGTWTSTDTTVTKIDHWTRDEDGTRILSEDPISLVKNYEWGDSERTTLLIQPWVDNAAPDAFLERYTRLKPLTGGITGVWSGDEFVISGDVEALARWTLTIGDGIFMAESSTDPDIGMFSHSGDLRHDSEEGFLFMTVTSAEGSASINSYINEGHELKYAYAQIGSKTIVVSKYNDERTPDGATWVDLTGPLAFGSYWLVLERQQQEPRRAVGT